MRGFDLYLIKSHKQIRIDPQSILVKKHAHYASARKSSNQIQVASSSNKFLNLSSNLEKIQTSKQVIINTYSSFELQVQVVSFQKSIYYVDTKYLQ